MFVKSGQQILCADRGKIYIYKLMNTDLKVPFYSRFSQDYQYFITRVNETKPPRPVLCVLHLYMEVRYDDVILFSIPFLRFFLRSWEGAAGAGRLWLARSELRAGRPEEGEALCPGAVLPVHQHQHPLATGHPLSGQHLAEPLSQEDLFW